ncbi:MAG TPA: hypothetical protein VIJ14_07970 [Rhabdochlamydiaceae bacterium]
MSMQNFPIVGLTKGLQTNVQPAMLPDQALAFFQNEYCWRERWVKREGRQLLGRLTRVTFLTPASLGTTPPGVTTLNFPNIFTTLGIPETLPGPEFEEGSLVITIGAPDAATFTDLGNGTFSVTGNGLAAGSFINYVTGNLTLNFIAPTVGGAAITITFNYFPDLPVMGIPQRILANLNQTETIWFDTTYAYVWNGVGFQEFIPGTTWNGGNADFFWSYNYQGATSDIRLFWTTNFFNNAGSPIRYTDGVTWTDFAPLTTATTSLFQSRIIIAYYGRLLMLNTWEGITAGGYTGATNFFNRCRFSQLGDPTDQVNGWRTDIFGRGGVIDAPTNEAITGATFVRNTLVVDFENSTWQLRYVGEYGLPFVWERVSSDFGSDSTFSGVLFDNYRLSVGSRAIISANGTQVNRVDLDIPDAVFEFQDANDGLERIQGIRNFQKELVYWNYVDSNTGVDLTGTSPTFPNYVLLYNYRNQTWAVFRDSITAFGQFQSNIGITWGSLTTFWGSTDILWSEGADQSGFELITCGDQQGFVSIYCDESPSQISTVAANDQETLTITAINLATSLITVQSISHNLLQGEIIYISGLLFLDSTTMLPIPTDLNNQIYQVQQTASQNTFQLLKYNFTSGQYEPFVFTPAAATSLYVGGGRITLFPQMNILTKDINLFQGKSKQTKLSRLDFLVEPVSAVGEIPGGAVNVNLWLNATLNSPTNPISGNILVGNQQLSLNLDPSFYTPGSQYAWFSFYATLASQYFSINITYGDALMNTFATHSQTCTVYGINAWCRVGGKLVY